MRINLTVLSILGVIVTSVLAAPLSGTTAVSGVKAIEHPYKLSIDLDDMTEYKPALEIRGHDSDNPTSMVDGLVKCETSPASPTFTEIDGAIAKLRKKELATRTSINPSHPMKSNPMKKTRGIQQCRVLLTAGTKISLALRSPETSLKGTKMMNRALRPVV
ncbi:hypothetical protein BZA05DRAFT_439734 [Tricharina praecox]|uniref:uncharacterized protein n=1 Tax=Tricharina praecox TaxID=43433 RepID=UPI0022206F6D|nr:uncharacterized protein BZA05DRAFT_439734 [Tricharina praecox]KAI5841605.1 hypothetical protein BZA05DRAFT_439734 [Tricharina praecox]